MPTTATAPFGLVGVPALKSDSVIHSFMVSNEPVSQVRVVKNGSLYPLVSWSTSFDVKLLKP